MLYLLKTLVFIDALVAVGLLLFWMALPLRHRGLVSQKVVVLTLLTPAVALFCGNVYLLYIYLIVVVAFNSRSAAELAGIFLFMLPSVPLLPTSMVVGGTYLFNATTVLAMGLGALIAFLVTPRRTRSVPLRYDLAMWALVGAFVFMNTHSANVTVVLRELTVDVLTFAGPYLLVSRAVRDERDLERIWLRLLMGATVMATTSVFQAQRNWVIFETYYQATRVPLPLTSAAMSVRHGLLRSGGSMLDYSAAGLFLAAMLSVLPMFRNSFTRQGFWWILALLGSGLAASQSRGAWVGAAAGLLFAALMRGRRTYAALLAGGGGGLFVLGKLGLLTQLGLQTGEGADTVGYRQQLASRGLDAIRAHPLFGQSPENLVASLADLTQGQHIVDLVNGHLSVAMTAGLPLFALWCGVWLMPIIDGWRLRRRAIAACSAPAATLVPIMAALTFTSFIDRNLTWPTIALALAAPSLSIGRVRQGRSRAALPNGTGLVLSPSLNHPDEQPNLVGLTSRRGRAIQAVERVGSGWPETAGHLAGNEQQRSGSQQAR